MTIITRFAPSPTGYLHVGNVRTALVNWLFTKKIGGKFILRIDDTDRERSKAEYVDGIKRDLEWLGLHWDEIYFQSERTELHDAAKNKLIESGRLYPCYESQEELEVKKKSLLARNLPPIYDRSSLKLTPEQKQEFAAKGIKPHYRFFINEEMIEWTDGIRGALHFDPKNIADPVLVRADGTMTYAIASVVDDVDLKITHIIRGEDHLSNSAVHVQMFKAFDAQPPSFSHLSLLKGKDAEISKRLGGFEIAALRDMGYHPMAILSFLSKLGSSDPIEFRATHEELIKDFDISKYGKSPAIYDETELERVNAKLLNSSSHEYVKPFLKHEIDSKFWDIVKSDLNNFNDLDVWLDICNKEIKTEGIDIEFTKAASMLLPKTNWDESTWDVWMKAVKEATGRNGKNLFMPIRQALTGMDHGPELKVLIHLLGYEKTYARLQGLSL